MRIYTICIFLSCGRSGVLTRILPLFLPCVYPLVTLFGWMWVDIGYVVIVAWACFAAYKRKDGSPWAWRLVVSDSARRNNVFLTRLQQNPFACASTRSTHPSHPRVLHPRESTLASLSRSGKPSCTRTCEIPRIWK